MPNRLTIIIENDTDHHLSLTDDPLDFNLVAGNLESGSKAPPYPFLAKQTCQFTVSTPAGSPGPDGWARYEFVALKIIVWVIWTDAVPPPPEDKAQMQEGAEATGVSQMQPFYLQWNRLDGAIGDLDPVHVKVTNDNGQELSWDKVPWASSVTVKYTLRVKNTVAPVDPPQAITAVAAPLAGTPGGAGKTVLKSGFRTWDAPGISQKRKKLLACIGNQFPMVYVGNGEKLGGSDPFAKVPFLQMLCWSPGKGTSCTSVNTSIEKLLTDSGGKWAFAAYAFQEAWVPWGANPAKPMPSVGDIYILYRDVVADQQNTVYDVPHERHCGFFLQVPESPNEPWLTADGGQTVKRSGDGAFVNRRPWELRVPSQPSDAKKTIWEKSIAAHTFAKPIEGIEYPYLGGGAESKGSLADANRLIGWLDLDSPAIVFSVKEGFDTPMDKPKKIQQFNRYSEYDYQFLGAWIDFLSGKRKDELAKWLAHRKEPTNVAPPWSPPTE
jgi:hypothetical protein